MKHESNDTPPFAPDDPISRSLFVRPNLIERLCASALRLCLLVCIPAAASVFLISLADSAEAACTSEPSQHYEVTTLIADHPVQTSSDPDFEEILKANARIAVESGEWSRRVKRMEETLIQWMRSPVFPEFRPMAVKRSFTYEDTWTSMLISSFGFIDSEPSSRQASGFALLCLHCLMAAEIRNWWKNFSHSGGSASRTTLQRRLDPPLRPTPVSAALVSSETAMKSPSPSSSLLSPKNCFGPK